MATREDIATDVARNKVMEMGDDVDVTTVLESQDEGFWVAAWVWVSREEIAKEAAKQGVKV